jgi:hypothetical protein
MRTELQPGEFGFRALINLGEGWDLTELYFMTLEDLKKTYPRAYEENRVKWPVEVYSDGSVYVPDQSELEEQDK